MGIEWTDEQQKEKEMERIFLEMGKAALTMDQYDLQHHSQILSQRLRIKNTFIAQDWKEFLTHPQVSRYIKEQFAIVQQSELRKIITDINSSKSTGQAQIMSTLSKLLPEDRDDEKAGPAFIYMYVPLNEEQIANSTNVEILSKDIFRFNS